MVIGEIIQELIQAHEKQKDVDLNRMKSRLSSKYGLESSPRLTDIIAAVPTVCIPSAIVLILRTKMGLLHDHFAGSEAFSPAQIACEADSDGKWNSCSRCDVQAASLPAY